MFEQNTIGQFIGYMNKKTLEDFISVHSVDGFNDLMIVLYCRESFKIDNTIPNYYCKVNNKLIRIYKFFPYLKRIIKDKLTKS